MKTIQCSNLSVLLMIFIFVPNISQNQGSEVTLSIDQRVELLKFRINEQIKDKQLVPAGLVPVDSKEKDYQYVETRDDEPITPVMDSDGWSYDGKHQLRKLATTTPAPSLESPNKPAQRTRKRNRKRHGIRPIDTFYRRMLSENQIHKSIDWLHCQDLITPFYAGILSGYQQESTKTQWLQPDDVMVERFIHLLQLNTSTYSKEDIFSILYQLNDIKIRIFQWDVNAVSLLLDTIVKGQHHTFRNIKAGISHILNLWHLDIHNTSNLLKKSRIYRPPCITTSEYGGSTKTSKVLRYSKITSPKLTCSVQAGNDCTENNY